MDQSPAAAAAQAPLRHHRPRSPDLGLLRSGRGVEVGAAGFGDQMVPHRVLAIGEQREPLADVESLLEAGEASADDLDGPFRIPATTCTPGELR